MKLIEVWILLVAATPFVRSLISTTTTTTSHKSHDRFTSLVLRSIPNTDRHQDAAFDAEPVVQRVSKSSQCFSRRNLLQGGLNRWGTSTGLVFLVVTITTTGWTSPAWAIPTITASEFNIILRDSARSIARVEFSGPRSETVTVILLDGTTFGLSDIIESSTDPRSPLKIAAACRENDVPYQFTDIQAVLAGTPKRTKVYTNQRVQDAAAKNREQQARIEQDERDRLDAIQRMEEAELKTTAATAASTAAAIISETIQATAATTISGI